MQGLQHRACNTYTPKSAAANTAARAPSDAVLSSVLLLVLHARMRACGAVCPKP
jgi:hypothetical protein